MAVRLSIVGGRGEGRWILARLRRVLGVLGVGAGEWTISVVGDAAMGELHGRTMGDFGTTDVLTFDLRENRKRCDSEGMALELDTVVCRDEARRRGRELGHGVREELLLYCVHSLLHVQGYDDRTAAGARKMHLREDELLVAAGVGRVYAGGRKPTESLPEKAKKRGRKAPGVKRSRRG